MDLPVLAAGGVGGSAGVGDGPLQVSRWPALPRPRQRRYRDRAALAGVANCGLPMSSRKNTRVQKAAIQYDGHNRKAGVSASNRAARNRYNRRNGKALAQNIVKGYVPYVFKQ